jgi:hypothetical protein
MSPPTFVALSNYTGDPKYLEFADKEYFATTEYLFREFDDLPGGLYLRDSTFFDPAETPFDANGNLIFQSNNGWVLSGLSAILRQLPANFSGRARCLFIHPFIHLFVHLTVCVHVPLGYRVATVLLRCIDAGLMHGEVCYGMFWAQLAFLPCACSCSTAAAASMSLFQLSMHSL